MITIFIVILMSFVLLGFFAGSEMAYLSCNKLNLRHMADEGNRVARIVARFHRNPKQFLATILIGTNLMHVTITTLVIFLFEKYFSVDQEWIATLVLAFLIIIFAETVPKDWFRRRADVFIYRVAPVLDLIDRSLSGISKIFIFLTDYLLTYASPQIKRNPFVTREEFRYVIEESTKGGILLEHEKQLVDAILNLSSKRVEEVMVPLVKFPKVSLTSSIRDVKSMARKFQISAVLVYEEIPSIVVGLIYVFDILFEENEDQYLSKYLRSPLFLSYDTSLEKALFILQAKHASYAAVINPDREVVGVVHLENLIQF